jgi:hypothetical protein
MLFHIRKKGQLSKRMRAWEWFKKKTIGPFKFDEKEGYRRDPRRHRRRVAYSKNKRWLCVGQVMYH